MKKKFEALQQLQLTKLVQFAHDKIITTLQSPHFNPRLAPYLSKMNKEGVPFTDFDTDPDNISQIKKVINGLYHAHLALSDVEALDVSSFRPEETWETIKKAYQHTLDHAYQACFLLTHLDVDIRDMFQEELQLLLPVIAKLQTFAAEHEKERIKLTENLKNYPISYKLGEITGTAVDQMQPNSSDLDFKFLTQFSADLPGYIHKLTTYIEQYSSEIKDKEPALNNKQLEELQTAALTLLNDLENIKGNSLFLSFKALNYIHIISNIITLSMSSLKQIGHLSGSTQDVIRSNLAQLKYEILPTLFGLIDKIEDNAMLKPGTLSNPLMDKIKVLYDLLIYYASKPVDFAAKGQELLKIEDSRFVELRLELTYKRIDAAHKSIFKIHKMQEALINFYELLDNPLYKDLRIQELPQEIREQLVEQYKILRPYMMQVDFDLNELLIDGLNARESWDTYLKTPLRSLRQQLPPDHVSFILASKDKLQAFIEKKIATEKFHINLNTDLIEAVNRQTQLILFPYTETETTTVFAVDELAALNTMNRTTSSLKFKLENGNILVTNPEKLTKEQAKTLCLWYRNNHNKLQLLDKKPLDERSALDEQLTACAKTDEEKAALKQALKVVKNKDGIIHLSEQDLTKDQLLALYKWYAKFKPIDNTAINECALLNTSMASLTFREDNGNRLLTAPQNLTADQALDLYQFYANKRDKFKLAKNAYDEFITLLRNLSTSNDRLLRLNKMDKRVKNHCRNLYNLFQPYFINGVPQEQRETAINFDKLLISFFKKDGPSSKDATINFFEQWDEHFQTYFTEIDLRWSKGSRAYLKWAHDKFTLEKTATKLEHLPNDGDRAHYVIQYANSSKHINQFRSHLKGILSHFNETMLAQLKPQAYGLPFPELEDANKLQSQGRQILAIKQIFNALYHLEHVVINLEQLNDTSYKWRYLLYIWEAYTHAHEIKILIENLAVDPHFNLIGRELLEKSRILIASLQQHSEAYQTSSEEVSPSQPVTINALWYTLNAFFISPKHIRTFKNNYSLTAEELTDLQTTAKNSTLRIEALIKSSDSYFQLFLQTPNMYRLYRDLTSKLNEFISTTHDTVMNNLGQFHPKIFAPMLLEADLWEDKSGLVPGSLSGPLKKVIDEYYKGLLHPLDLDSKTHINLFCNKTTLEKRIKVTEKKIAQAEQRLAKMEKNYKYLNELIVLMGTYEKVDTNGREQLVEELVRAYKKALPKLNQLQKRVTLPTELIDTSNYDELLNKDLKEEEPHLKHIAALVLASHNHHIQIKTTYQITLDTAKEKLTYLQQLATTQEKDNILFIKEYTTESFNKQLNTFCNRHVGLQYTDKEYRTKLREYLLTFSEEIINKAKTTDDINLSVKNLLKEKIKLFEQEHFTKYYHLDTVRVALSQFKNYFSQANSSIENGFSIFENELTLSKKTAKINKIIDIAENEKLSIDERFSKIKLKVDNVRFKKIILAHRQADHFSFTYLLHCILSLLEMVYLYTPARTKLYTNLNDAVKTQPQINELTKRFGLFATAPVAPPKEEEKAIPVASPAMGV